MSTLEIENTNNQFKISPKVHQHLQSFICDFRKILVSKKSLALLACVHSIRWKWFESWQVKGSLLWYNTKDHHVQDLILALQAISISRY